MLIPFARSHRPPRRRGPPAARAAAIGKDCCQRRGAAPRGRELVLADAAADAAEREGGPARERGCGGEGGRQGTAGGLVGEVEVLVDGVSGWMWVITRRVLLCVGGGVLYIARDTVGAFMMGKAVWGLFR